MADVAPFPAPNKAGSSREAANAGNAPLSPAAQAAAVRPRDPRLDFYRGLAMFIILSAHIPGNRWAGWIPARFGFSDATEIFVFCSGMASAIAFGGSFARNGWLMGTARVIYRVWQVYWAHIGLFFFIATSMAAFDLLGFGPKGTSYIASLNLHPFFSNTVSQIVGLFTLTYVPNYFDVLPMYLGVLALMPVVMGLHRLGTWAVALFCVAVWLSANPYMLGLHPRGLSFPAEPWSDREWFFNPMGWQLLFFTGFAFMAGWLPKPPRSRALAVLAVVFLVVSAPFGSWKVFTWLNDGIPDLGALVKKTWPVTSQWREKTDFGLLRLMHFLSLAYLAWLVAGENGTNLLARGSSLGARIWTLVLTLVTKVGQQSLAVFVFSMAAAQFLGALLDQTERAVITTAAVNIFGFALLIACAYSAAWFKSQPWRRKR